ncbi:hypothetical protein NDU88_001127 [Pleurodeles waltl]|uniref:Integrase catalytic domain-containing protein n=1 Tax=Pleurodeles waltl TaxID=8319 RepID=A0AAV7Q2S7_PLEWA|nr:hypothetical protein NDU88_001127 [Pleurodeles waltl]
MTGRSPRALLSKGVERKKVVVDEVQGDYKFGDWERVVKGGRSAKGESTFSEPLEGMCYVLDNEVQFVSNYTNEFLCKYDTEHIRASVYYPQSNSLVERWNRTLKEGLQLAVSNGINCRKAVKDLIWSNRTTPHSVTGKSPVEVMTGMSPRALLSKGVERKKLVVDEVQGDYKFGNWVHVVKGGRSAKGESNFSEPLEVRKVYKHTLLLSDGNASNHGKVVKVPVCVRWEKLFDMDNGTGITVDNGTSTADSPFNESDNVGVKVRDKSTLKLPKRFDDFVIQ